MLLQTYIYDSNHNIRVVYDWRKRSFRAYKYPKRLPILAIIIIALGIPISSARVGIGAFQDGLSSLTSLNKSFMWSDLYSVKKIEAGVIVISILAGILMHLLFILEIKRAGRYDLSELENFEYDIDSSFYRFLKILDVKTKKDFTVYIIKAIAGIILLLSIGLLFLHATIYDKITSSYTKFLYPFLTILSFSLLFFLLIEIVPKFYLINIWINDHSNIKNGRIRRKKYNNKE